MKAQRITAWYGNGRRTEVDLASPGFPYAPRPLAIARQYRQLTLPGRAPTDEGRAAASRDAELASRACPAVRLYRGTAFERSAQVAEGFARVEEHRVAASGTRRFLGIKRVAGVTVDALVAWSTFPSQPRTVERLRASLMHAALWGLDGDVAVERPVYAEDGSVATEALGTVSQVRADLAERFSALDEGVPQVMSESQVYEWHNEVRTMSPTVR